MRFDVSARVTPQGIRYKCLGCHLEGMDRVAMLGHLMRKPHRLIRRSALELLDALDAGARQAKPSSHGGGNAVPQDQVER